MTNRRRKERDMLSFDPSMMNPYLYGVFSLAVIALALAVRVATTEVRGNRRLRPTLTSTSAPRREVETSVAENIVRFESHTVVQRSVTETFERLADLPGYGGWMHRNGLFRRCGLTSQLPVRARTTYVDSTWMGTFDGELTEFVPPTRIAFRETLRWFGSPLTQARPEYSLEGDETATIVHHVAVGELYGWMRFMRPVAAWMANRERTRTLNSLKRSLESD
jgi:uncharacterized protein YndB with AHSA1/START domain